MKPGDQVRLKGDPGRLGVLTDKDRLRRDVRTRKVMFPDGAQWVPEDQLEPVTEDGSDPLECLEAGRFGHHHDLRRLLTHVRLTGRLADLIYSMDTTGTDFYAYQFKPIVKLLNGTTNGILIADEVGLGKTIEAGLIWTELRSRFDFRRLLVVCPAMLREKWRRELVQRFGVEAEKLGARETLTRLESAQGRSTSAFAIVGSLQGLRPPRGWDEPPDERASGATAELARFIQSHEHEEPIIDLVVIDEAHYLRNPGTMSAALGRLLQRVSAYVVLLSATPVHLKSDDLFHLVNLVDPDTFDRADAFDDVIAANEPLVRIRDRLLAGNMTSAELGHELESAQRHPLLRQNRQIQAIRDAPPSDPQLRDRERLSSLAHRIETANLLGHVVTRTRKRDVHEWRVQRKAVPEEIPPNEIEREFYDTVTKIVRQYCARAAAHEAFLLVTPQRQMSSSMPAALRSWKARAAPRDVDLDLEVFEDLGIGDRDRVTPLGDAGTGPLVQEILSRVEELGDLELLTANDSKYERLRECLTAHFQRNPTKKVVLFSYFRETLRYLRDRLKADDIATFLLLGGMEEKDAIVEAFERAEDAAVLLSSEVGSEGIDLQFADVVINYDLPWNPMRVEQRIGRLDRLGQQSPVVHIWNLFYADTIDSRIYHRLFVRLQIFEQTLGAVEPVLGDRIQKLTSELMTAQLSAAEELERIQQTEQALANVRRHEQELEDEATNLVAYGDYILNQVQAARELSRRIRNEDIQSYVLDFFRLHYAGCEFDASSDDGLVAVALSNPAKHDFHRYLQAQRLEAQTRLAANDPRPVACRFENSAVRRDRHVETISQFHPLVRFVSSDIEKRGDQFHPAVAVRVDSNAVRGVAPDTYVFAVQRWAVGGLQEIEQLRYSAVSLSAPGTRLSAEQAETLVVVASSEGDAWLSASSELDKEHIAELASDCCFAELDDAFDEFLRDRISQNEDRADVQERMLSKHFDQETRKLREVREIHEAKGRSGLVKATEGRMRKLKSRVERRHLQIAEGRAITPRKDEICVGVIRISG